MLLTLLGVYAGIAAVYMGLKYAKTADYHTRKKVMDNAVKIYLECLKWPGYLLDGITGFDSDRDQNTLSK